jgi:DNA invertase Pin-like site-specific DNA recombinase
MARKSRKIQQADNISTQAATAALPAWIYARISQDSDHADDSIDNQIAICKDFIYSGSELAFGGVFTDLGYSGTNFERPGYFDLMAGVASGEVKCVVVKDLSRLGRTYIEVGELLFDTFVQYGIRFVSVNDHYDSFAADAGRKKLLILFKNLVNHMYSRDLGKKIKSAHAAKKKRGEPAGLPPYGYRHDGEKKQLVIFPNEADVVRQIFDMRQSGESAVGISKALNQQGVTSPQNGRYQAGEIGHSNFSKRIVWSAGLVSRILHNETYTGTLFQGKYDCSGKKHILLPRERWIAHENTHDAIISKEQFNAVSRLLAEASEKYKKTGVTPYKENQYSGIIYCSRCGKAATRTDGGHIGKKISYYYACYHCLQDIKHEQGLKRAVKMPLIRLDAVVMETLRKHIDALVHFDGLAEMLSKSDPLKQKRALLTKERAKLEKTVGESERNLSAAYTHHLEGLLDLREYELVRVKIENDKTEAEARLAHIKAEQIKYDAKAVVENQWLVKFSAFRDCETPTKDMIQALVKRITLVPMSNELNIELNYTDSYEELQEIVRESGVAVNVQ